MRVVRFCSLAVLTAVSTLCACLTPAHSDGAGAGPPITTLNGNGSVDEAWLTGANPGDRITLAQHDAAVPVPGNPGTADALGSLIVRNLRPGHGYSWHDDTTGQRTRPFPVRAPGDDPPANVLSVHAASRCTRG